jgi:hypothetical protein
MLSIGGIMPRRNHAKGRRPQAQRGSKIFIPTDGGIRIRKDGLVQKAPRPKLLPMVPATGTCPTGKIRYGSAADAEEALRRAVVNREILHSEITETRYYPMPGDRPCECGGFHLTSSPRRAR